MKPTIYLFLLLFSLTLSSQSITFQKCLGGSSDDLGKGIEMLDGNIYISSTTRSYGGNDRDIMVNKLDGEGNLVWTKVMGSSKRNLSFGIKKLGQDLIVYGQTLQDNDFFFHDDIFLKCLNTEGDLIWEKYYGSPNMGEDETAGGFTILNDNEILFSAFNLATVGAGGTTARTGYIGKTNALGEYIWSFAYDTIDIRSEWIQHLFSTPDAYYASGRTGNIGQDVSFSNENELFLMKTTTSGEIDWWKFYNIEEKNNGFHYTSISLADGSMLIVGGIKNTFPNLFDILLVKVDAEGNVLWSKSYGGEKTDIVYAAFQNWAGDIILSGYTNSYGENEDALLMKISTDGDILWTKTYGRLGTDRFVNMKRADNGDILLIGRTNSYCGSSNNIYLVRSNNEGEVLGDFCYENQEPFTILDWTMTTTEGGHSAPWQESTNNSFQLSSPFLAAPGVICLTTDVDEVTEVSSFKISPNPFTDQLIIETDGFENEIVDIRIINLTGQQLFFETKRVNGNITLNTKSLPNGLLILNLNTANKQFSSKIIKTSR